MAPSRRTTLVVVGLALAAVDLAEKAREPVYGHPRSLGYVVLAATLLAAVAWFVPRVPSRRLAVCGGFAAAGALGNHVSALAWRGGVPNPLVLGDVAFNLADVFAFGGAVALVAGAAAFALRHPGLLREPLDDGRSVIGAPPVGGPDAAQLVQVGLARRHRYARRPT